MIHFAKLEDMEIVRETISHPKIYPHVSDDLAPKASDFVPCNHPSLYYLGAYDDDEYLGLWMFAPSNSICWEVHTCLLPVAWGARSVLAARGAAELVWKNTPCRRIITTVPASNVLALRLATQAGFERYGVNPRSFLKNGELLDQILLGISKPEEILCQ